MPIGGVVMADETYHLYGKPSANDDAPKASKSTRKEQAKTKFNQGTDTAVAREQLRTIVERIERLEEEKKAIGDDIREVYGEAKSNGFDTKVLRQVVALRKKDLAERQEEDAIRDLYMQALGMLPDVEAQS